ncbi:MAG: hypothetical protein J6M41_08685 [Prevotella sp.]|nr:hypothetical protein [Prevotella sp.]
MRKETMLIVAAVLFALGLCLCSGVDQNPWQAVIALPMMGGAAVLFNRVDAKERVQKQDIKDATRSLDHAA